MKTKETRASVHPTSRLRYSERSLQHRQNNSSTECNHNKCYYLDICSYSCTVFCIFRCRCNLAWPFLFHCVVVCFVISHSAYRYNQFVFFRWQPLSVLVHVQYVLPDLASTFFAVCRLVIEHFAFFLSLGSRDTQCTRWLKECLVAPLRQLLSVPSIRLRWL